MKRRTGPNHTASGGRISPDRIARVRQLVEATSETRAAIVLGVAPATMTKLLGVGMLTAAAAERVTARIDAMGTR